MLGTILFARLSRTTGTTRAAGFGAGMQDNLGWPSFGRRKRALYGRDWRQRAVEIGSNSRPELDLANKMTRKTWRLVFDCGGTERVRCKTAPKGMEEKGEKQFQKAYKRRKGGQQNLA